MGANIELINWLRSLPMYTRIQLGTYVIGILHGDIHSLSGWDFSYENIVMESKARKHVPDHILVSWLEDAGCDLIACTHTCLPVACNVGNKVVINNGSAGMPNFKGRSSRFGVCTRISVGSSHPPPSISTKILYSYVCQSEEGFASQQMRIDALAIDYDSTAWERSFLSKWPPNSPAYLNYFQRISEGTHMTIPDAVKRGNFFIHGREDIDNGMSKSS